jgi:hypothetical protein
MRYFPRITDAQYQLLFVLRQFGPMPGHALLWKSGLPDTRSKIALRVLLHRRLVEPLRGDLLQLTPAGRELA